MSAIAAILGGLVLRGLKGYGEIKAQEASDERKFQQQRQLAEYKAQLDAQGEAAKAAAIQSTILGNQVGGAGAGEPEWMRSARGGGVAPRVPGAPGPATAGQPPQPMAPGAIAATTMPPPSGPLEASDRDALEAHRAMVARSVAPPHPQAEFGQWEQGRQFGAPVPAAPEPAARAPQPPTAPGLAPQAGAQPAPAAQQPRPAPARPARPLPTPTPGSSAAGSEDQDWTGYAQRANLLRPGDAKHPISATIGGMTTTRTPPDRAALAGRLVEDMTGAGAPSWAIRQGLQLRGLPTPEGTDAELKAQAGREYTAVYNEGVRRWQADNGGRLVPPEVDRKITKETSQYVGYLPEMYKRAEMPTADDEHAAALRMAETSLGQGKPFKTVVAEVRDFGLALRPADRDLLGRREYGRAYTELTRGGTPHEQAVLAAIAEVGDPTLAPESDRARAHADAAVPKDVAEQMILEGQRVPAKGEPISHLDLKGYQLRAEEREAAKDRAKAFATARGRAEAEPLQGEAGARVRALRDISGTIKTIYKDADLSFVGKGITAERIRKEFAASGDQVKRDLAAGKVNTYNGAAFGWLRQELGNISPQEARFRQAVAKLNNQIIYAYSGKQITDQEFERMRGMMIDLWQEPTVFIERLGIVEQDLRDSIANTYRTALTGAREGLEQAEREAAAPPPRLGPAPAEGGSQAPAPGTFAPKGKAPTAPAAPRVPPASAAPPPARGARPELVQPSSPFVMPQVPAGTPADRNLIIKKGDIEYVLPKGTRMPADATVIRAQ